MASAADTAGTAVKGYFDPAGYIIRTGLRVASGVDRTRAPNKQQRIALAEAGYTVSRQQIGRGSGYEVWTAPTGKIAGPDTARRIARALPQPAPAPQLPTGGDILEDLLRRPSGRIGTGELPRTGQQGRDLLEDILRRNPDVRSPEPAGRSPVERAPRWARVAGRAARVLGRVGGVIGGVLYPSETSPDDVLYPPGTAIPAPQPDRPRGPPRRPVRTRDPRDLPKLPGPFPETVADRLPRPDAPAAEQPLPFPVVLPGRDPAPSPAKRPRPATVPAPTASPAGLPLPISFPFPLPSPRVGTRPILSPLNASVPGRIRDTLSQPLPSPLTLTKTGPIGSPPSDRCSCPPKQKRKPSKPRTVCYTGSYREKSRGLSKTPRRKVPCL